jgi:hypothetical protein
MNYLKPIAILGYLVPMLALVLLFAAVFYGFDKVSQTYSERSSALEQLKSDRTLVEKLEQEILPMKSAVAWYKGAKEESMEEMIPPYISELCEADFDGYVKRDSIDVTQEGVKVDLTGRYDSAQKFLYTLSERFLFLSPKSIGFSIREPDSEIPSKHISIAYEAAFSSPSQTSGNEGSENGGGGMEDGVSEENGL